MQRIFIFFVTFAAASLPPDSAIAQALYNNGATLNITSGTNIVVQGDFTNAAGSTINNAGTLKISGNTTNNATMASATGGVLSIEGSSAQTLGGTADYFATNVVINNAAGVTLGTKLRVAGALTFTGGLVNAPLSSAPLAFTASGTVSGTPTDASHVNGYILKEGTGSFDYPTGDAAKYQKTTVNLSANGSGMLVKYNSADAGNAPFTTGGTDAMPLASYSTKEYWDISPLTTASGTVTIYWDGYNDTYSNSVGQRRVAHKTGGNWLNEGTSGSGTVTAGSVTSNSLSSWSPFALGSVISILPIRRFLVTGMINADKTATINWHAEEINVSRYEVEKSLDNNTFSGIGEVSAAGNGWQHYSFTENNKLIGNGFYRIKQIDSDGHINYSAVIKLSGLDISVPTIYPTLARNEIHIIVPPSMVNTSVLIVNASGQKTGIVRISESPSILNTSPYANGTYFLHFKNGTSLKFIKL